MMKQIIIGPTFFAAGKALQAGSDVLVIGNNNSIGDEWCYSYRQIDSAPYNPNSELAASVLTKLQELPLNSPNQNALALSVMLYELLEKCSEKFKLWTEIESIREVNGAYELTLYTVSGREVVNCEELIDNRPEAYSCPRWGKSNIKSKRLNMLVHDCATEMSASLSEFNDLVIRPGRNNRELVVEYTVDPEATMILARQQLLKLWMQRPEHMLAWKIGAFGAEFDYDTNCDQYEIKSNFKYLNPLSFSSPLAAFDAGLTGGRY
jgi:hypothetical protein